MKNELSGELEQYRNLIGNTGGNSIECLIGRLDSEPHLSKTNSFVFTMAISVDEQVKLLRRLHALGVLLPMPVGERQAYLVCPGCAGVGQKFCGRCGSKLTEVPNA